jgi:hypothetical protein
MWVRSAVHGNSAAVLTLYPRIRTWEDYMASIAQRGPPIILLSLCLSSFVFAQGNLLSPTIR